jgi:hypothetical protein
MFRVNLPLQWKEASPAASSRSSKDTGIGKRERAILSGIKEFENVFSVPADKR